MNFADLSFRKKILTLLALPMLGFVWLSVSSILRSNEIADEMSTIASLTELSVVYSELVHELQKERGMTAGFIGSKGQSFTDKLINQRKNTDEKRRKQMAFWRENESQLPAVEALNKAIETALRNIENIRQQVNSHTITLPAALKYYTQINKNLLSLPIINVKISSNAQITEATVAYYNFLQGKERAGIERAVLSNTFAKGEFSAGMLIKFITLMSEQNTYFDNFNQFASQKNQQFFLQQLDHPAVKEVLRLRGIAKNKSSNFGVKAEYWFEQSTGRIGQLKKVENQLGENILKLVEDKESSALNSLIANIVSSLVLITLAIAISFYAIKELTERVKNLTAVMGKVRHENDLTATSSFEGNSDLGQIATSLNKTLGQFADVIKNISSTSVTLSAAAEETSQTCETNSNTLGEQQDSIALVATAIEQLSATVQDVAANTQSVATSARETDEKADKGLKTVQDSYHTIEILAQDIDGLALQINHLHESSNDITRVLDVIKSVAEQTNLLALNAAIEAARAGEQGRGFSVVADEVRTLAQRTQESTSEIENFISSLQADANAAFNVIEASQKKAENAVDSAKNVELMLEEITVSISRIFAMTEQVATAIEEQSVVTQDIAENVVSVEQKSIESTTGANQIAITAKEQAKLATSLLDMAKTFKV